MNSFLALLKKRKNGTSETAPALPASPDSEKLFPVCTHPQVPCAAPETAAAEVEIVENRPPAPAIRPGGITRSTSFLRRPPAEFSAEERALRDEKAQFVREVYEYARRAHVGECKAAEHVASACAHLFPHLSEAGKGGTSALCYPNYRNWLTGTSSKPGLGRLADGSPDYGNADVLLRNYGCEKGLYGDPAFWESFKAHCLQPNAQKIAKIYRLLEFKWRLEYPGMDIPALHQIRTYVNTRWPKRFLAYMRQGENYYLQHYRNFVERDPESIRPNEAWVADSQDCDFMIRVPDGRDGWDAVRPKICVIMDIKSQHLVSIQLVSRNEQGKVSVNNEIIRNAFAMGVWRYGRPRVFLTDNGTDYCAAGFTTPVTFTPSVSKTKIYSHSIMLELDVLHLKAEKYNARAKYVERFFREMAEYTRGCRGYVGNCPENRPATAKVWAKEDNREHLMSEADACKFLGTMIRLYHEKKCPDSKYLRGLSPDQAFAPELRYSRPAMSFEEYKRAFLLPLEESRTVELRGSVRYNNKRYVAVPEERSRIWKYDAQPVMIKTDLLNDNHIFLFSLEGAYICEARTETMMPYFARLTSEEDAVRLAKKLEEIRAEKKYLDTMAMDETGGWHKLDPWKLYQLPREAFLGPARLALLDTMYSVKGETHNPRIHVLPEELRHTDIAKAPQQKKEIPVCTENSATHSTEKPDAEIDPELHKDIINLLSGGEEPEEKKEEKPIMILDNTEEKNDDKFIIPSDFV